MNPRTLPMLFLAASLIMASACSKTPRTHPDDDGSIADTSTTTDQEDGGPHDDLMPDTIRQDALPDVGAKVKQWVPFVVQTFTSQKTHDWKDFPLQATFVHEGGTTLVLDGYWTGGQTWRIRFSPTLPGAWTWMASSKTGDSGFTGTGSFYATPPSQADMKTNPNLHGHVHVNGEYFTYADKTPFLPLGDTFWRMNSLLPLGSLTDSFNTFVKDRVAKKFNTVLIMYISSNPNEGGYLWDATTKPPKDPTVNWSKINPAYFDALDTRIQAFWDHGMVIFGHPTWIVEITEMTFKQAVDLSHYLLSRYGAYNLVWSLTGEFHEACKSKSLFCDNHFAKIAELGKWVGGSPASTPSRQGYNPFKHPMSVHPGGYDLNAPDDDNETSRLFDKEPWLDHHWVQTYAETDKIVYRVSELRGTVPGGIKSHRPVLMSEPSYEDHQNGRYTDWDQGSGAVKQASKARRQAWTSMFVGAAGHIYGAHGIWEATTPAALDFAGSGQVHWVKDTLLTLGWPSLAPAPCVEIGHGTSWSAPSLDYPSNASDHAAVLAYTYAPRCLMRQDKTYAIYIPAGNKDATLRVAMLGGKEYKAHWINPRDGSTRTINGGALVNTSHTDHFEIPSRPATENNDWVLILER